MRLRVVLHMTRPDLTTALRELTAEWDTAAGNTRTEARSHNADLDYAQAEQCRAHANRLNGCAREIRELLAAYAPEDT